MSEWLVSLHLWSALSSSGCTCRSRDCRSGCFLLRFRLGQFLLSSLHHLGLLECPEVLCLLVLFLQSHRFFLLFQDVVHQHSLVLEGVSLDHQVQAVVLVLVNLPRLSVLLDQFTEDSDALHP